MELIYEMMLKLIENNNLCDIEKVTQNQCYKALSEIKNIISDDKLTDFECIEEIVCIFERMGSSGGSRHDF